MVMYRRSKKLSFTTLFALAWGAHAFCGVLVPWSAET